MAFLGFPDLFLSLVEGLKKIVTIFSLHPFPQTPFPLRFLEVTNG